MASLQDLLASNLSLTKSLGLTDALDQRRRENEQLAQNTVNQGRLQGEQIKANAAKKRGLFSTVGTVIGTVGGAVVGSAIPGAGTLAGAQVGASIGGALGGAASGTIDQGRSGGASKGIQSALSIAGKLQALQSKRTGKIEEKATEAAKTAEQKRQFEAGLDFKKDKLKQELDFKKDKRQLLRKTKKADEIEIFRQKEEIKAQNERKVKLVKDRKDKAIESKNLTSFNAGVDKAVSKLDDILSKGRRGDLKSAAGLPGALGIPFTNAKLRNVPGSGMKDIAADIQSLSSDVAITQLLNIKKASKTGGAFGAISEKELDLLINSAGSMDLDQSNTNLIKNLNNIRSEFVGMKDRATQGFNDVWGEDQATTQQTSNSSGVKDAEQRLGRPLTPEEIEILNSRGAQ